MFFERTYSKAKSVANHAVWTPQEIIPVGFNLDGVVPDQAQFALLQVRGQPVYCIGYRVECQVPASSRSVQFSVSLQNGAGTLVPNSTLVLNGAPSSGEFTFSPALGMPTGSVWQAIIKVLSGSDFSLPEGLRITYLLRYANGPVTNDLAVNQTTQTGVGFWRLGQDFIVS